jgi:hypothetical protein
MASQVTVTGTFNDVSGTALVNSTNSNSYLRFRLRNFQGFVPTVQGTAIIVETQIDALPGAGGAISQLLWPNSAITPGTTFYTCEFWSQGRIVSSGNWLINGATNLNTAAQLNTPPVPPGFELVLQNNGADNSSQSTLNLESTDSSVIITDEGSGNINLQAATGFAAGTNIFPFPQFNGQDGGLSNYTLVAIIPASMVQATGSSCVLTVKTGSNFGGTGWEMTGCSIGATLPARFSPGIVTTSTTWTTAPVAITFPAGSFSSTLTDYPSNPIDITVDTEHDYYITLYLNGANTANVPFLNFGGASDVPLEYAGLWGYIAGNHTADANCNALLTLSGGGNLHAFTQLTIG